MTKRSTLYSAQIGVDVLRNTGRFLPTYTADYLGKPNVLESSLKKLEPRFKNLTERVNPGDYKLGFLTLQNVVSRVLVEKAPTTSPRPPLRAQQHHEQFLNVQVTPGEGNCHV